MNTALSILTSLTLLYGAYSLYGWHLDEIDEARQELVVKTNNAAEVAYEDQKQKIREEFANGTSAVIQSKSDRVLTEYRKRVCLPCQTSTGTSETRSGNSTGLPSTKRVRKSTRPSGGDSSLGLQGGLSASEIDFINRELFKGEQ